MSFCCNGVKGECITSSFTYGVPFEMTAELSFARAAAPASHVRASHQTIEFSERVMINPVLSPCRETAAPPVNPSTLRRLYSILMGRAGKHETWAGWQNLNLVPPIHAQRSGSDANCHRWGLILAGGDGTRLLPLTRRMTGNDRPKQFCAILGQETLLQQTRHRISPLIPRWRTLLMLSRAHERYFAEDICALPSSSVLIQPSNRGTAPAILYSLLRIYEMDPAALIGFFPSDHYFSDDEAFVRQMHLAYDIAAAKPGSS